MPVPDFQSFFKPILDIASDGQEHSLKEVRQKVASLMQLSENDLSERLPSGIQTKFENRISWAISYFVQAKILVRPKRGHFLIMDRGRGLHKQGHKKIDFNVLNAYPEFLEFHTAKGTKAEASEDSPLPDRATLDYLKTINKGFQGRSLQMLL